MSTFWNSATSLLSKIEERFTYNDSFIGQTLDYKDFSYTVLEVIAGGKFVVFSFYVIILDASFYMFL
jgi:hypothetical protein